MQKTKLTGENISFERNNQWVIKRINFVLTAGDSLQIYGQNGCGKSTLLRILAGFIEPQEGTLLWQDQFIHHDYETYQSQLHYLGHQNGIKPHLTVEENLHLCSALFSQPIHSEFIQNILEQLNLQRLAHSTAMHLSAGQLRRLALAKFLLKPAPIWILDEPTTALDSEGQQLLINLLNKHLENGNIAVIATHHHLQLAGNMKKIEMKFHE